MPAKNCLSLSEKKNLQEALKTEENYKIRERILMFLLLDERFGCLTMIGCV